MRTLIIILLLLSSCTPEMPFTIRSIISMKSEKGKCIYTYNPAEGLSGEFIDSCNKYQIGDTIK